MSLRKLSHVGNHSFIWEVPSSKISHDNDYFDGDFCDFPQYIHYCCSLLNTNVSISNYIALNDWVMANPQHVCVPTWEHNLYRYMKVSSGSQKLDTLEGGLVGSTVHLEVCNE
jgi:hypothetical protein